MSILLTGGTGFIGAEIVRNLLEADSSQEIIILHRSGNFQRIQDLVDKVQLIQCDLADHEGIDAIIAKTGPDVIYHFGAMLTSMCEDNPQAAIQTNAIGTYQMLESARKHEVRQLIFASSIGSYGRDIQEETIDDTTLQRPVTIYGVSKVFGEQLGMYYKSKYGLDFRGLRYPVIIGPGVKTFSVLQLISWLIEEPAKGNPFTINVEPDTRPPTMYYKDAARAAIELSQAPLENINMLNYLIAGVQPQASVGEFVETVRGIMPDAQINFQPDKQLQALLNQVLHPVDDSYAREEWGWQAAYDTGAIIEDFIAELKDNPERYA